MLSLPPALLAICISSLAVFDRSFEFDLRTDSIVSSLSISVRPSEQSKSVAPATLSRVRA